MFKRTIEDAQEKVEKHNFEIRKHLLEYDDVLNQQRSVVYSYRRNILENTHEIVEIAKDFIADSIEDMVAAYTIKRTLEQADYNDILVAASKFTNIPLNELHEQRFNSGTSEIFKENLISYIIARYDRLLFGPSEASEEEQTKYKKLIQEAQKWLMLETIDQAWKQHMLNLDYLKEGIHLRSWGQKNPLIEYKRESFMLFEDMMRNVRAEIVSRIFRLDLTFFDPTALERRRMQELEELKMRGPDEDVAPAILGHEEPRLSRAERRKKKR